MDKKKGTSAGDNLEAKSAHLEVEKNNLRETLKQCKAKLDDADSIKANLESEIQKLSRDKDELLKTLISLQTKHSVKDNNIKITTTVIPATDNATAEEITKIKKSIQADVFYLENITKCCYYPVPTIIVDYIPREDQEEGEGGETMHWLGVYFHQGSEPSKQFKDILKNYGYKDLFINSLFETGVVAIGYQACIDYADRKFVNHTDYNGGRDAFRAEILNAVLIHEHAHAVTFEGIDSANCQVRYEYKKFCKTQAYKIVCESIAEWLSLNYYRDNPAMFQILTEHSNNNNASLLKWPYGGAIYLEKKYKKDNKIFNKIFNAFRENIEETIPLYLKGAAENIINFFCSYKADKKDNKIKAIAKTHGNILKDAIELVNGEGFIVFLIRNGADVNEKDNNGVSLLMHFMREDFVEVVKHYVENIKKIEKITRYDCLGKLSGQNLLRGKNVDKYLKEEWNKIIQKDIENTYEV